MPPESLDLLMSSARPMMMSMMQILLLIALVGVALSVFMMYGFGAESCSALIGIGLFALFAFTAVMPMLDTLLMTGSMDRVVAPLDQAPLDWSWVLALVLSVWSVVMWVARVGLTLCALWFLYHVPWWAKRAFVWYVSPCPIWLARWLGRPQIRVNKWSLLWHSLFDEQVSEHLGVAMAQAGITSASKAYQRVTPLPRDALPPSPDPFNHWQWTVIHQTTVVEQVSGEPPASDPNPCPPIPVELDAFPADSSPSSDTGSSACDSGSAAGVE